MSKKIDLPPIELEADIKIEPIVADLEVTTNSDIDATIKGSKEEPIAMMMLGDQRQPISAHMTGDKENPVATAIEMTNLPRFTVEDIKEMMRPKMRISLPGHRQLCFKLFGRELFTICYGGEGQLIIEPYKPRDWEKCNDPVCDVDTRPFPETKINY